MEELSAEELQRYNRHLRLSQLGTQGQIALKNAKVLVIGAGGLGSPALLYLAAAGVGHLGIVDGDLVDLSNLQRQVLFQSAEVGMPKARAAAQRLQALNPLIRIDAHECFIGPDNALDLIRDYDLVIDGSDNFSTRYLVNDACILLDKPLVYGALHQFSGQLSVFNYQGGPSYRCLYPEPPEAGTMPNCAEAGVLGVLPGIIGTLQATEAIKIILGLGQISSGILCLWDSLNLSMQKIRFGRIDANFIPRKLESLKIQCSVEQDQISAGELEDRMGQIQLLDVRENWEREICTLPGSVHYDPQNPLIGLNRDQPIVVYCHTGLRSEPVCKALRSKGYQALNLTGGIDRYALEINPELMRY